MAFIKPIAANPAILKEFAEDKGYSRYQCSQHGGFYSDCGAVCPYCPADGRTGNAYEDSRNASKILLAWRKNTGQ